ncbi:methyl-accepting chemotaxis protein [Neptunicella sp. SCSIO 80796]|uniref:methyl-accepting chemotaxis protein n=1 Tax=Neptunicella plasticusilytica TaxID=3117012 RepID=UPI003A4D617A
MSQFINNLSLRKKLLGIVSILNLLLILSSAYAIYSMTKIGNELEKIAEQNIKLTELLMMVTVEQLEQVILFERATHYGAIMQQVKGADNQFDTARKAFSRSDSNVVKVLKQAEDLVQQSLRQVDDGTAGTLERILNGLKKVEANHNKLVEQARQVFEYYRQNQLTDAEQLALQVEGEADDIDQTLDGLLAEMEAYTLESVDIAHEHESSSVVVMLVVVVISVIFGMSLSLYITNMIIAAIRQTIVTASGDLSQEIVVDSSDEIGELKAAMNGMRLKLLDMLGQISGTTSQLSAASEEMSVVTRQTSQIIDSQHQETSMIAAAINQMSTTAQQVAESVNLTAQAAYEATDATNKGADIVKQGIEQINRLAKQVEMSAQTINDVGKQSETISTVLEVIKGIADQTNLLALNAAIEAARAGEQGRGFAVVADEVRTLASRTQKSTDEINSMIEKLQAGSQQAVSVMQKSQDEAKAAVEFSVDTGQALDTIAQAVDKINQNASHIASAATEQGAVAEEINSNIARLNEMSNQTAEGAEETATATDELTRMAVELQGIVDQFKV